MATAEKAAPEVLSNSAKIRNVFKEHGLDVETAKVVELVPEATPNLIANIRCRLRAAAAERKANRKARKAAPERRKAVEELSGTDALLAVKELAARLGGLDALVAHVETLKRLAD